MAVFGLNLIFGEVVQLPQIIRGEGNRVIHKCFRTNRWTPYETIARKAAALGHSLISNHPFVDGNQRVGHAAMEVMLILNGYEIVATVDDQ